VDESGVRFWDATRGKELRRWDSPDPLFSARYSPDNTLLATGSDSRVLLWNVATGKLLFRVAVPGEVIKAIAFSADGKLLAAGGDKKIRLWNVRTCQVEGEWSDFPKPVEAVAFSGDGKTLFSGHREEFVLRRWDVGSHKPLGALSSPITPVRLLSFSQDSRTILTSATGEDFYLWESASGKPRPTAKKDDERFTTDWLATSGRATLLRCEDGIGIQFAMLLLGKDDRLEPIPDLLGSSIDGQRLLVRTEKDKLPCLRVLKPGKGTIKGQRKDEVVRDFVWKDGDGVSAALSPDGKTVAAAGKDVVCFFDVTTGAVKRYPHPTNVKPELLFRTQSTKFSADGTRIALVGNKNNVRILAVKDGRRLAELTLKRGGLGGVSGLAFSPDGQTLLTTSMSSPVFVWEVATGQMVRRLELGTYVFSPDNRLLAGSAETLKVFDLYSGRFIRECKAEGNGFGNFAFSPDSRLLAASCADTTVVIWPTTPTGARASNPLDENDLARILETGTAAEAYEAIGRMIADPDRALPFLERRLRAVPQPDAAAIQRLIGGLGSELADQQESARLGLTELGPLVEPALRVTLSSDALPAGSKKQIEQLLQNLDEKPALSGAEDVLHIRAIQVLERIGTKRAKRLLEAIARGAESSPRTRAAVEALARLGAQ
jgi:WD40 repeat protein